MYDLRIVVDEIKGFCDMPMKVGDYFELRGGRIIIPEGKYMCMWALQSLLPILPAKQRKSAEENDWIPHTKRICCPDPNGMVIYRIDVINPEGNKQPEKSGVSSKEPKPRILVDEKKCTGCRACETICSFTHTESFRGENSRIRIQKNEQEGYDIPFICRQCGNAPCVEACPRKALSRDPETMAVLVDGGKCIGCRICSSACPFSSIRFNKHTGKAVICDLCGGSPECVKRCPVGAVSYGNAGNNIKTNKEGE